MQIFSVSDFLAYVNDTFKAIWDANEVAVEGEVSGYRLSQGQWASFDLKDDQGLVNIFLPIWKQTVPIEDGARVRVFGVPRVYPKYGKFSLSAERVELVGEGALRKALVDLRKRLETEGMFEPSRKRSLVRFPHRVALIASRESAAYGDFIRILKERWGGLEIDVHHVLVQGERAPQEIARAIQTAGADTSYDALVLTRGGGSFEELMAFNDERVVRALFASKVPTLVGIGHERDLTLAEEVADIRGSTPTDCARRLVPDRSEVLYEVARNKERVEEGLEVMVEAANDYLNRTLEAAHRWQMALVDRRRALLEEVDASVTRYVEGWQARTEGMLRLVASFDPKAVLRRGFAVVRGKNGKVLVSPKNVVLGERLQVALRDGGLSTLVESKT